MSYIIYPIRSCWNLVNLRKIQMNLAHLNQLFPSCRRRLPRTEDERHAECAECHGWAAVASRAIDEVMGLKDMALLQGRPLTQLY